MSLFTTSLLADVLVLVAGFVGVLYLRVTKNSGYWRKKRIPYLPPTPFVGNLGEMLLGKLSMGEALAKLYLQTAGKPFVGIFALHRPVLLARDLDFIKRILVRDFSYFQNRAFSPDERYDPMIAKGLFGLNAPKWQHLRTKLTPTFTSAKMKLVFDFVNECGRDMCSLVEREMNNGNSNEMEMREILARYTTDAVASVGFGVQANSLKDPDAEFRIILRKFVEFDFWKGVKFALAFVAPRILSLFRLRVLDPVMAEFSRRVVWQTVEHRERTGVQRKDYLDMLMQIRSRGHLDEEDEGSQANDRRSEIKDAHDNPDLEGDDFVAQAFVFLIAGNETSSSTQTFALYELACHPDVQTRLRQEVRDSVRVNGGRLTYDAVHALPLMDQVVQETLRLHPVLPFLDRECVEDYRLPNGAVLEKGSSVFIPILGIQRDPEHFEDPDSFRPERFAEGQPPAPPFSILPFGEGPRICIGKRMGLMLVKIGLAHFLDKFEVKPSKRTQMPVKLDPQAPLLAALGGMHLEVTKTPGCNL